ncbi:RNA-splicing factor [Sporothrix epigloea]|uniref:RNA-splicing factor n=1 Tax=Sporothrix epigloea TaxID=1892477 RepID=A0ABP0E0X4_9PEZI
MGSGDLNTKKSWHVVNLKNQRKVWESEQAALAERKKVNERIEELRKERQEEEITRQLEAAGGTKHVDRVDWMYQGPSADNGGMVTEEAEAFLLGKRRIDSLLRGTEHKQLEKNAVPDRFATVGGAADTSSVIGAAGGAGSLSTAASARDMAAKIREDPLLAIKRQEQQSYAALANDPIRRRQIMAAMGLADGSEHDRRKSGSGSGSNSRRSHNSSGHHRSSHRSHRNRDDNYHSDDNDERRYKRSRRDDSRDEERNRDRDYRRSGHDSIDGSGQSSRRDGRGRDRERGKDDRRKEGGDRDYNHENKRQSKNTRSPDRSRSRSPPRRDRDHDRYRNRSKEGRRSMGERDDRSGRQGGNETADRNGHDRKFSARREPDRPSFRNGSGNSDKNGNNTEERARKLAAMQANAADLAKERQSRLTDIEAKESAEREADKKAREEDAKLTGNGVATSFGTNLRKKAGGMDLSERLGRSRQGLQRDED